MQVFQFLLQLESYTDNPSFPVKFHYIKICSLMEIREHILRNAIQSNAKTHRKGLVCISAPIGGRNRRSPPSSRRRQQSTGLLHLIFRVPSWRKNNREAKASLLFLAKMGLIDTMNPMKAICPLVEAICPPTTGKVDILKRSLIIIEISADMLCIIPIIPI